MKRNKKHFICLSMACALAFSTPIMEQIAHAQQNNSPKIETGYTQNKTATKTKMTTQKKNTKKILVIKNKKTKGITYPLNISKDNSMTYPGKIKDNSITYPDRIKDNSMTYPDHLNDDPITYPDYLAKVEEMPVILDEEDAYDYLFEVLSGIKKYKMNKNDIEDEDPEDFPFATDGKEWYFAYGPKTKGEFIPTKYFAVSEDGEIFEYNEEEDAWFILVIAYKN